MFMAISFVRIFLICSQIGNHSYKDVQKMGNHLYKDLAKYGYKPDMKYKSLINFWYFGYMLQPKYKNLAIFFFFSPLIFGD
jgi:hypothetical protein